MTQIGMFVNIFHLHEPFNKGGLWRCWGRGVDGAEKKYTADNLLCKHESFQQDPARELPGDGVNLEISLWCLLCTKMQHIFSRPKPFPENGFLILCLNSLFTEPTRNLWSNGIKRLNLEPLVLSL